MILFLISDIFLDDFINVKSQWREMLLSDMRSRQTKWLATVVKWLQQCQRRDNWCWASPRSLPLHFPELSSGSGESQQEKEASHSSQLVNNIRSDWGLSLSLSLSPDHQLPGQSISSISYWVSLWQRQPSIAWLDKIAQSPPTLQVLLFSFPVTSFMGDIKPSHW